MRTEFDVVLTSINDIEVTLPLIGNMRLIRGREYQLLNAKAETINSLRSMFSGTGVKIDLNKKSNNPFYTFDYREAGDVKSVKEIVADKSAHHVVEDPLTKIGNFELPSGKYKGKKLCELTDDNLKNIYRLSKTETVKAAIDAFFALKRNK